MTDTKSPPAESFGADASAAALPQASGRAQVALLGWATSLCLTLWGLSRLGQGALAAPPTSSLDALSSWAETVGLANSVFAIVRLLALGCTWYLVVVTVLGLVSRASGKKRLVVFTDLVTVPAMRRVLTGATGIGLTLTSVALPAVPLAASLAVDGTRTAPALTVTEDVEPDGVDVHQADDVPIDEAPLTEPDEADAVADGPVDDPARPGERHPFTLDEAVADWTRGRVLAAESALDRANDLAPDALLDDDYDVPVMRVRQGATTETWTAGPGDHLWDVSARTLEAAWGRSASDAEVVLYWVDLLALNRAELADPENPDLIFPGQVFQLPTPPPAP